MYFVDKEKLTQKLTYLQGLIDILELENVISKETQTHINDTVDVRKQFAHNYTELNVKEIMPLFDKSLPYYKKFIKEVAQFLESENVPITAFGKGENQ